LQLVSNHDNTTLNPQNAPLHIPDMLGRLVHLGIDAILLSAFLAGIKRSTGLTPALSHVPNKDVRELLRTYLEVGEYVFDFAVVVFGRSSSFERRRST